MEGLEKINKWLHVWTEAERAARVKKPAPDRLGTVQVESPASRTEEGQTIAACQRITQLPRTRQVATRGE